MINKLAACQTSLGEHYVPRRKPCSRFTQQWYRRSSQLRFFGAKKRSAGPSSNLRIFKMLFLRDQAPSGRPGWNLTKLRGINLDLTHGWGISHWGKHAPTGGVFQGPRSCGASQKLSDHQRGWDSTVPKKYGWVCVKQEMSVSAWAFSANFFLFSWIKIITDHFVEPYLCRKIFLGSNPIGSMVLGYMLTWLGYIDGIYVTIYTSTMDPMGILSSQGPLGATERQPHIMSPRRTPARFLLHPA